MRASATGSVVSGQLVYVAHLLATFSFAAFPNERKDLRRLHGRFAVHNSGVAVHNSASTKHVVVATNLRWTHESYRRGVSNIFT